MDITYYLTVFPSEALISSQLTPQQFGSYMATGSKKGSAERLIFIELEEDFGDYFDWVYAKERTVAHANGDPKHSVYLSVYRALEHTPIEVMKSLFLTNKDGRTLKLEKKEYTPPQERGFRVYKEMCPTHPVIVSTLAPKEFCQYMTNPKIKTSVPKLVFADLKVPNLENPDYSGNIGGMYSKKFGHLMECIASVKDSDGKRNKTFDRSLVESFTFQVIDSGVYVGSHESLIAFPMPSLEELKEIDYDWGRSALII
jgi:hypothetical protein